MGWKRDQKDRRIKYNIITREKIEKAASLDATNEEIAYYAGISRDSLQRWFRQDEELRRTVETLRQRPALIARESVVNHLAKHPEFSLQYLSMKKRKEFSTRQEVSGPDGGPIEISIEAKEKSKRALRNVLEEYGTGAKK